MNSVKIEKTALLRQMRVGDPPMKIRLSSAYENNSFSVLIARYNQSEGKDHNKYVHASYDNKAAIITLVCISYEQYEKEKNGELDPFAWKNELKKVRV